MTCHYEHIFLVKSWYRNVKSVLLTDRFCLHAGLNQTAPIKRHNKTLTKVTDNNLKIPIALAQHMIMASAWRLSTLTTISMCGLTRLN